MEEDRQRKRGRVRQRLLVAPLLVLAIAPGATMHGDRAARATSMVGSHAALGAHEGAGHATPAGAPAFCVHRRCTTFTTHRLPTIVGHLRVAGQFPPSGHSGEVEQAERPEQPPPQQLHPPLHKGPKANLQGLRVLSSLGGSAPSDPLAVILNTDFTSVASGWETSEASAGRKVPYSGNGDLGAVSADAGATFTAFSPSSLFGPADGGCCGDQVVQYLPQINRFAWLAQYNPGRNDENRYRLGIASPTQITDPGGPTFKVFDLPSSLFGLTGQWMDFPHMSVGANDLYIAFDVARDGGVVVRIPVSALAAGTVSGATYWSAPDNFLIQVAQGRASVHGIYMAKETEGHPDQMQIIYWPESSPTPYAGVTTKLASTPPTGDWSAPTPGGVEWLKRLSGHPAWGIVAGTQSGNALYFAWSAARGTRSRSPTSRSPRSTPRRCC